MSDLATPMLEIDKIKVVDGFNPRTAMDPEALAQLAGSIEEHDLVQPIAVRPDGDGGYILVAGERRLQAAKLAGKKEVPYHVRTDGNPLIAALIENLHREDLNAIDTGRGIQELAKELDLTNKMIAEHLDKSEPWVNLHRRLLKLPEGVQTYIALGLVPKEAERDLRKIAKVSPRIAECICELAKRRKIKGIDFTRSFGDIFAATAHQKFDDQPTMIDPGHMRLSTVISDAETLRQLAERHLAARPYHRTDDPVLNLSDFELDAARAAGCLVEHNVDHGKWTSTISFITDVEFAADLAVRAIERIEKQEADRKRAKVGAPEPLTPDQQKEERRTANNERKERAAEARSTNEVIGLNLIKRRGSATRKQFALSRVKAMAIVLITDNPNLAARGLRLVSTQLQEVEVKQLKTSGERREKISYATAEQATSYLIKRVEDSRSVNEVTEIVGDAMIASLIADEQELPQSKRVRGELKAAPKVLKLLSADIKSVRPRRRRRATKK